MLKNSVLLLILVVGTSLGSKQGVYYDLKLNKIIYKGVNADVTSNSK